MRLFRFAALMILLAAVACAPRPGSQILSPGQDVSPSGAPSAVPLPLPTYPHDPGYWV